MIVLFPCTSLYLLYAKRSTPYGRHARTLFPGEPSLSPQLAWTLQEAPNLCWLAWALLTSHQHPCPYSWHNTLLLVLFAAHYLHRTIIYPLLMPTSPNTYPLSTMLAATAFTTANAFAQVHSLTHLHCHTAAHSYTRFCTGVAIFLCGMYINIRADAILRGLRKGVGAGRYSIPRGFMFEYVSCANLFGEVLEWFGFAVSSHSLAGWMFSVCTTSNLLVRALAHHQWYHQQFPKYPRNRMALFPFVL
jgi:hypothetical protein